MRRLKTKLLFFLTFTLILASIFLSFLIVKEQRGQQKPQSETFHKEAARIASTCFTQKGNDCYSEEFKALAKTKGLFFAEHTLYKLWDLDKTTRRCHILAHVIAKEATRQNPEKWEEYLQNVNYTTCSAGFLHGVMEAHIGDDADLKVNANFINDLCFKGDFYKKQNCVHYMGHLLMIDYGGDVRLALDGCEGINEGLYRRCYTGVFMEDSFPLALVEHGLRRELPNRQNPEFTKTQEKRCRGFEGDLAVACWTDMGENYGVLYDDPQKVYDACFGAPNRSERTECFLKAAGLFAIHPAYSTDHKLVGICAPGIHNDDLYKNCIGRMISSVLYYSPNFSERAAKLCSSVGEKGREECFSQVKKQIEMIASQAGGDKAEFCKSLSDDHKDLCIN